MNGPNALPCSLAMARSSQTVGERLRSRRLELGFSQRDIAAPGVSYAYISRIEGGSRTLSVRALRVLAAKLDTAPSWLEFGESDPAEELARMLLVSPNRHLPLRAFELPRRILGRD
jgi:transcriptional regulator with XRE-family HTH domain